VTCNSSEALFEAYLDDTLTPARRASLQRHLARCGRCAGVLEELRVVDALLVSPRVVELPENFTFATMAEVRSLPRPHASPAPVVAYLVSYLVAAWLLIGAASLLAGSAIRAFGETLFDFGRETLRIGGSVGHAGSRIVGDFGSLGTFVGGTLAFDLVAVIGLVLVFTVVRPRLANRLRP